MKVGPYTETPDYRALEKALEMDVSIYKTPEPGDWQCELFGVTGGYKMVLHPAKGGEPNWFWRKMQYLCFGNRWTRAK